MENRFAFQKDPTRQASSRKTLSFEVCLLHRTSTHEPICGIVSETIQVLPVGSETAYAYGRLSMTLATMVVSWLSDNDEIKPSGLQK